MSTSTACLEEPPSDLFYAVKEKRWKLAFRLLEDPTNNNQVDYVGTGALGFKGVNTLHWAAFHPDTPSDLLKKILKASPKAALVTQHYGVVPLQSACRFSCDENVIVLVKGCPEAARVPNSAGDMALHYIIIHGRNVEAMKSVLEANPKAALAKNKYNDSPLSIFFEEWEKGIEEYNKNSCALNRRELFEHEVKDCGGRRHKLKELYEKTILLLEAAVNGSIDKTQSPLFPLHLALKIPVLPPSFFELLLRIHMEHVSVKDENGDLPLHLACASKSRESCEMVTQLLNLNPDGARLESGKNRTVLFLAIESGKYRKVQKILALVPGTLLVQDKTTGMYPFMAAAIQRADNYNAEQDLEQLNAVFSLLREEPSSILWGTCSKVCGKKRKRDE